MIEACSGGWIVISQVKFSMKLSGVGGWRGPTYSKPASIAAIKGNYELIKYLYLNRYERYDVEKDEVLASPSNGPENKIFSDLRHALDQIPTK